MNVYEESIKLAPLILSEIYHKEFGNRKEFDEYTRGYIQSRKVDGISYKYVSLYLYKNFTFHLHMRDDKQYSVITFMFNMIRNDDGFNKVHLTNISMNTGTPAYWFNRNELTNELDIKDELSIII